MIPPKLESLCANNLDEEGVWRGWVEEGGYRKPLKWDVGSGLGFDELGSTNSG